jgi:elongation factor Ts
MENVTAKEIAGLRAKTGIGMMECKGALIEAKGDETKAIEILRKKGGDKAAKRADRETKNGIIEAYIHANGKIGVMVEVLSETDFVSKGPEFKEFAHDLALHIAAMGPKYVCEADVPEAELAKEKELLLEEVKATGKPADIAEKIVVGRLGKFYEEICLLNQPFVKDDKIKIQDMLNEKVAKTGEKIIIARFCRFEIGV